MGYTVYQIINYNSQLTRKKSGGWLDGDRRRLVMAMCDSECDEGALVAWWVLIKGRLCKKEKQMSKGVGLISGSKIRSGSK